VAKSLAQTLKEMRTRARKAGPRELATFDALDEHYAKEASRVAADLEALRQEQGITRSELAKRSGLDPAEISKILNGRSHARIPTAQRIARALKAELRAVPTTSGRAVRLPKSKRR
jgi:DNA-binding XRE family transcriptional regulator